MANEYSRRSWENHDVDFVPEFYLPANRYQPTTPSRTAYWHQVIEYTRSLGRVTRYTMKLTVFVFVALVGLMLSKPAVAEAPVFEQLPSSTDVNQILANVTAAQASNAVAVAASSAQSDDSSSDESLSSSASPSVTAEEVSVATTTEQDVVTNSTPDESAAQESTSSSSGDEVWAYEGSTGCCIWPTRGRVTSRVTRWHTAIDIAAPYWTPVVAADGGRVVAAGWDRTGYGYRMIIDHGSGLTTLYAHLSRYYYDYGDYVNKGMIIGRVGSTGNSSGNHLHFEVRVHNYRQNPWNWLP